MTGASLHNINMSQRLNNFDVGLTDLTKTRAGTKKLYDCLQMLEAV